MDLLFLGIFETLIQAIGERYGVAAAWIAAIGGVAVFLGLIALAIWWIVQ